MQGVVVCGFKAAGFLSCEMVRRFGSIRVER